MKRDGRSFDHRTLEAIRLMAVERVRDGEAASAVIAAYGFSRTTIYKWLTAATKPGLGMKGSALDRQRGDHGLSRLVRRSRFSAGSTGAIPANIGWTSAYGRDPWWPI
jgi:hypothetical protein